MRFSSARDPVEQHVGGEGLQDVVGGREFGGANDFFVCGFGGDDDEHRPQGNELVVAQIFQQLLPILPLPELVFAQDEVVGAIFQGADGGA